ncbi:hypothetical protein IGI04_026552 [Brassica rapa subsp. trilocularis]|uniref:TIR domain-containing protein n=1 Tax=Brassica rapa subsp. trilocularis TaxID=1813537 RepID=A0ABQ7KZ05_BRACM|nr:hypothetical protein IGI04_026552 [Brassica rapa subsp. trilocularis]
MAGEHQMVYVCVSGEDVPDGFLSHLKGGLESKGFSVFTHEGKMREEAKNRHKILNRIRVSRFVLVIFSDEFGGSAECLDTLVLVMKRMYLGKLRTIPIYYMMHQHEPKYQKGNFGYMLDQLEKAENRKAAGKSVEAMIHTEVRFNEWREALAFVTNKKGFEFHHQGDSLYSTFIEEIAKHIIEGGNGSISEPQETQTKCQLFGTPVYEDEVEEEHYMAREAITKSFPTHIYSLCTVQLTYSVFDIFVSVQGSDESYGF